MARSVNRRMLDAAVSRQVDLISAADAAGDSIVAGPSGRADRRIAGLLASVGANPRPEVLRRVLAEARAILEEEGAAARAAILRHADEVGLDELVFSRELLARPLSRLEIEARTPTEGSVLRAIRRRPLRGVQLATILARVARADRERSVASIRDSLDQGFAGPRAARLLVGTRSRRGMDGDREPSRVAIRRTARTVTSHASAVARSEVLQRNEDVVQRERWVATLDTRTSNICQSLDGRTFPLGEGIHPPAHPNCRSARIPIVEGLEALPVDPAVQDVLPSSVADSFDGAAPEVLTYERWLREQPERVQRRVLGRTRFALFQRGLGPRDFVTDGLERLTIPQLRARHPEVFEDADL